MKKIAIAVVFLSVQAFAAEPVPHMLVEIYHVAPGQHTAFLEVFKQAHGRLDSQSRHLGQVAALEPRNDGSGFDRLHHAQ